MGGGTVWRMDWEGDKDWSVKKRYKSKFLKSIKKHTFTKTDRQGLLMFCLFCRKGD